MYQNYMNTPVPMTANGLFPSQYSSVRQEIVKVNGENGARAYQLAPNCSALLLDENNPIVWLVQTDGAGYKTVTPYSITLYQPKEPISLDDIETRLKRLEDRLNESDSFSNGNAKRKSSTDNEDVATAKSRK